MIEFLIVAAVLEVCREMTNRRLCGKNYSRVGRFGICKSNGKDSA